MPFDAGSRVDRYTLVTQLGEGGQGSVWKAEDPLHPGVFRALKLIDTRLARGAALERLRQEARLLAKLRHPSLCLCHGLFEDLQCDVLGFAMDFISGQSLEAVLEDPRFTRVMREHAVLHVARALAHVHSFGAVHRDVKLTNVIVDDRFFDAPDRAAHIKLVDFGIAALDGARQGLTAAGHAVGTPAYMAPEQIDPSYWGVERAGLQADLFAFGILCWHVFIGGHPTQLPPDAGVGAYLMAYRKAAADGAWPPRMPTVGAVRATRRCLVLQPLDRLASAEQLVARLEDAMVRPSSDGIDVTSSHAMPRPQPVTESDQIRVEADVKRLAPAPQPPLPPVDRTSWLSRLLIACIGCVAIAGGSFAATLWSGGKLWRDDESAGASVPPSHDVPVALPSTTLDNGGNGNELPPPLDVSCNNCPTNQPCMPDCDTQIAPTDEYVLRLMTVTYSPKGHVGDAAALKNIRVQICAPQCVDVTDGETGVPMTGSQLARGFRIQISERDETMFVDWKGASYNSPAQRRSICKGYSFRFDRNSTLKYRTEPTFPNPFRRGKLRFISFYLDPPGTRRARCPHKAKWLP